MQRTFAALAAATLLAGACATHDTVLQPSGAVEPGAEWLRTDRTEYAVRTEGAVRAVDFELSYHNQHGAAVAVPSCHSPVRPLLEKRVGGTWVHAYQPVELMCITPPLVIRAGEAYHFRYAMRLDDYDLQRWPGASGADLTGTYRLVWLVGTSEPRADAGFGAPLPSDRRTSNEFRLTM